MEIYFENYLNYIEQNFDPSLWRWERQYNEKVD